MRIDPTGPSPNSVGPMAENTSVEFVRVGEPDSLRADPGEGDGGDGARSRR